LFNPAPSRGGSATPFATIWLRIAGQAAQANCFFKLGLQRIAPDSDLQQHSAALGSGKKSVTQTWSPAESHSVA